jgi:hypothetical protein
MKEKEATDLKAKLLVEQKAVGRAEVSGRRQKQIGQSSQKQKQPNKRRKQLKSRIMKQPHPKPS